MHIVYMRPLVKFEDGIVKVKTLPYTKIPQKCTKRCHKSVTKWLILSDVSYGRGCRFKIRTYIGKKTPFFLQLNWEGPVTPVLNRKEADIGGMYDAELFIFVS